MAKDEKLAQIARDAEAFVRPFRVTDGERFRLKDVDPADTCGLDWEKRRAHKVLERGVVELAELQERLWAQDSWGLLLVFQAMDAAGKDGTIKHVFSGVNPQGCQVYSFKAPSREELDHDFLWRTSRSLPERGRIGIFNRSYYEEVLVVRVHPELLANQRLPRALLGKDLWDQRLKDIRSFERYVARNGFVVLKFFLHVSREEQRRRFLARLADPSKRWKFSAADVGERAHWKEYMQAYEAAIRATAAEWAPWYVVPADNKWFTHLVVAAAIVDALADLDLRFPRADREKRAELQAVRRALLREGR